MYLFVLSPHGKLLFQIYPEQEISQDDIFGPPLPVAYPAYSEPHRVGHPQYYGQITPVSLFTST